ncbi:MAG TPA: hypothetical protein VF334_02555, partial [Polyangia bacterium]
MRASALVALFCATAAAAAGCGGLGSHDVELVVGSGAVLTDAVVASVQSLEIGASSRGHGATMTYPLGRPLARTERIVVHTTSDQGPLAVGVIAHDAAGNIVAAASGSVMLDGSGPHTLSVGLMPVADGQLFTISPTDYTVFTGQTIALTASTDVTWSIMEGTGGGTVDPNGYHAPSFPGTYHLIATANAYYGHQQTATVQVLANGIANFAGQLGGSGYADGPRGIGRLISPWSMVSDGPFVYFTTPDKLVRKLDVNSGELSTIAGALDLPSSMDGTGPDAHFGEPRQIAYDGSGNLYVADMSNSTIRKVVIATGVVTTFAGSGLQGNTDGVGTAARFFSPYGLAWDGARSLYVADQLGCSIRKIDLTSAQVSTVVGAAQGMPPACGTTDGGPATARLGFVSGLAWDGQGALYVSDSNTLRKVVVATGVVTTVAGSGGAAIALDGNGALWTAQGQLSRTDLASGQVTQTMDPHPGASGPWYLAARAVTFAPDGTMYVATDDGIYSFDPAKSALTLVGGTEAYSNPLHNKLSTVGGLGATVFDSVFAIGAGSDGIIYTRPGDLWVKIDPVSGTAEKFTAPFSFACCSDIVPDGQGNLYVLGGDGTFRSVTVGSASGGRLIAGVPNMSGFADGAGNKALFSQTAQGLAVDFAHNTAFIADTDNFIIRKIDLGSGAVSTFAGTAMMPGDVDDVGAAARLARPRG